MEQGAVATVMLLHQSANLNWLASHGKLKLLEDVCVIIQKMFGCKPQYAAWGWQSWWLPGSQVMWHNPENVAVVPSGDACTWQLPAKWQDLFKGMKQSCYCSSLKN